ncbi:hypothetical protein THASP1DRAFT_28625 [Thamnocephalis sphaerospora]|uniref:Uncharacterized protein n=1 Tax=Thamnocephalis sphaerospora TaxID=78915 RepID=A0A4P9XUG3_9FUNG|nr:hypothetical protein THASP1DRAFT_28625 [Thamnocephalis sphaerospora]|eukprot:RKP09592.1 hypothetical protein THASP1DRAFT_28625 [Thamnocephalis sphaerospora]
MNKVYDSPWWRTALSMFVSDGEAPRGEQQPHPPIPTPVPTSLSLRAWTGIIAFCFLLLLLLPSVVSLAWPKESEKRRDARPAPARRRSQRERGTRLSSGGTSSAAGNTERPLSRQRSSATPMDDAVVTRRQKTLQEAEPPSPNKVMLVLLAPVAVPILLLRASWRWMARRARRLYRYAMTKAYMASKWVAAWAREHDWSRTLECALDWTVIAFAQLSVVVATVCRAAATFWQTAVVPCAICAYAVIAHFADAWCALALRLYSMVLAASHFALQCSAMLKDAMQNATLAALNIWMTRAVFRRRIWASVLFWYRSYVRLGLYFAAAVSAASTTFGHGCYETWQQVQPELINAVQVVQQQLSYIALTLGADRWFGHVVTAAAVAFEHASTAAALLPALIATALHPLAPLLEPLGRAITVLYNRLDHVTMRRFVRTLFEYVILSPMAQVYILAGIIAEYASEFAVVLAPVLSWWQAMSGPIISMLCNALPRLGKSAALVIRAAMHALHQWWEATIARLPSATVLLATSKAAVLAGIHDAATLVSQLVSLATLHISLATAALLDFCRMGLPKLTVHYTVLAKTLTHMLADLASAAWPALDSLVLWLQHAHEILYNTGRDGIASVRWWLVRRAV